MRLLLNLQLSYQWSFKITVVVNAGWRKTLNCRFETGYQLQTRNNGLQMLAMSG